MALAPLDIEFEVNPVLSGLTEEFMAMEVVDDIISRDRLAKTKKWQQFTNFKNRKPCDHLEGKVALKKDEALFIAPLDTNCVRVMNIHIPNLKGAAVNTFDMKSFKFSVTRYDGKLNKFVALTTLQKIDIIGVSKEQPECVEEDNIYWLKLYRNEHHESKISSRQVYNMNITINSHLTCAKFISPFIEDEVVTLDVTTGLELLKHRLLDIFGFLHSTLMFNIGEFDKHANTIKILPSIHNVKPGGIYYFLLERKSSNSYVIAQKQRVLCIPSDTHVRYNPVSRPGSAEIKTFRLTPHREYKPVDDIDVVTYAVPEGVIKYAAKDLLNYKGTVTAADSMMSKLFANIKLHVTVDFPVDVTTKSISSATAECACGASHS